MMRRGLAALAAMTLALPGGAETAADEWTALPPVAIGAAALDDVLHRRRSTRALAARELSREQVGQLCWAAQGITEPSAGLRTAPSAGALYPLVLYVVVRSGVYRYEPRGHRLKRVDATDRRAALAQAALGQDAVREAPLDLVLTAAVRRTRAKYGDRAERYAAIEAGHAAQNVLLEATALGLGAVPIGAIDDDAARRAVGAGAAETPLYVLAIGHPRR
jgi:SagB-type dehydrogenase family enzyme